jgi:isocitrate dehydrogenase
MDTTFNGLLPPQGERVRFDEKGKPYATVRPIIPFIEGDGIGRDVWFATRAILDAAVHKAYGGKREIAWFEVFAGEKANDRFGEYLPQDTIDAIRHFGVAIKGPLMTPTGGGFRSLNVTMRQTLDLYSCVRPVRHFKEVPSVVLEPNRLNVVIFRENTEDIYAGIEFEMGTEKALALGEKLKELGSVVRGDAGIGVKVISRHGSKRLVRAAIRYALETGRRKVTIIHKGNIQKYTEGSFRAWGYEVAREEFADLIVTEDELDTKYGGKLPDGKILVNDRIADAIFHDVLTKPDEFSVIAATNLNGDYLSDACAAQVGGLGIAPGANIGDGCAIFEATHGTWPKGADLDIANPGSLLLSGVMMLEYLGWKEAAALTISAFERTIAAKTVTGDLARLMKGSKELKTSQFTAAIIANMTPTVAPPPAAPVRHDAGVTVAPPANFRRKANMAKVSIVGAGGVGATAAQYISQKGLADVVLVDVMPGTASGKGLDLLQAGAILGDSSFIAGGDYADTAGSDIVVIAAGVARKPGMSRDDLLKINAAIVKEVCEKTLPHSPNAIYIVVTNPLDVMAHLAWKTLGLPAHRVIGMAGVLDSARFQTFIAQELGVSANDVRAMVLGGHGDLMVPLPRYSTVNGIPIPELMSAERVEALCARTRDGGAEIVSLLKTGSAFYAPGASVALMVQSILQDEKRILPCSVNPGGAYGLKDVYIGLPIVLGRNGVEKIVPLKLRRPEKRALTESARSVIGNIKALKGLSG